VKINQTRRLEIILLFNFNADVNLILDIMEIERIKSCANIKRGKQNYINKFKGSNR